MLTSCHLNEKSRGVCIKTRSTPASLAFIGQVTKQQLQNGLFLSIASLLRTIFAALARAHERVHVQNVRDFPRTKLDSERNAPFLLNEHGNPRLFYQVFAKGS